jgi:hypothetical protein
MKPGQRRVYPENTFCAGHRLKMVHEWCGDTEQSQDGGRVEARVGSVEGV